MQITEKPCKLYLRKGPDLWDNTKIENRITKTRPICGIDDRLYICNKVHQISFNKKDIPLLKKLSMATYKNRFYKEDSGKYLSYSDFQEKYLIPTLFQDREFKVIKEPNYVLHDELETEETIDIIFIDETTEILTKTGRDIKKQQLETEKANNRKIVNTFFIHNIKAILNKYGMELGHLSFNDGTITFSSEYAFTEFVKQAITNTVCKELEEIGIKAPFSNRLSSANCYATYFMFDDLKPMLDE